MGEKNRARKSLSDRKYVCAFAGSASTENQKLRTSTQLLGQAIAKAGLKLLYGGGSLGLMGNLASSVIFAGGHVTGVVPRLYDDANDVHPGLSDVLAVNTIEERKLQFRNLSFAYIALPGGLGTLDEITDVLNVEREIIPSKPCILFNIDGFYKHLIEHLHSAVNSGMIRAQDIKSLKWCDTVEGIISELSNEVCASDSDI